MKLQYQVFIEETKTKLAKQIGSHLDATWTLATLLLNETT